MYSGPNHQNIVIVFCMAKQYPLDKPRFLIDCHLRNLAIYKKETPLPNIKELIKLVVGHTAWSKIDTADRYCNIRIEESSKQ